MNGVKRFRLGAPGMHALTYYMRHRRRRLVSETKDGVPREELARASIDEA